MFASEGGHLFALPKGSGFVLADEFGSYGVGAVAAGLQDVDGEPLEFGAGEGFLFSAGGVLVFDAEMVV